MILYAAFQPEYSSALPRPRLDAFSFSRCVAPRRAAPRRVASHRTALHRRVLAIYIVFYAAQLFSRSAVALDLAAPEHTIARETANETQATTPP